MKILNVTRYLTEIMKDMVKTLPTFRHIDARRVVVVASSRRCASPYGEWAKCYGLKVDGQPTFQYRYYVRSRRVVGVSKWYRLARQEVVYRGRRARYVILFKLPRGLRRDVASTVAHELYHINEKFDGSLRPENHGPAFDRKVKEMVDLWFRRGNPRLVALARKNIGELKEAYDAFVGQTFSRRFVGALALPFEKRSGYARDPRLKEKGLVLDPSGVKIFDPPLSPPHVPKCLKDKDMLYRDFSNGHVDFVADDLQAHLKKRRRSQKPYEIRW